MLIQSKRLEHGHHHRSSRAVAWRRHTRSFGRGGRRAGWLRKHGREQQRNARPTSISSTSRWAWSTKRSTPISSARKAACWTSRCWMSPCCSRAITRRIATRWSPPSRRWAASRSPRSRSNDYATALNAGSLKNQGDVLHLAARLEKGAANAYLGVIPSFNDNGPQAGLRPPGGGRDHALDRPRQRAGREPALQGAHLRRLGRPAARRVPRPRHRLLADARGTRRTASAAPTSVRSIMRRSSAFLARCACSVRPPPRPPSPADAAPWRGDLQQPLHRLPFARRQPRRPEAPRRGRPHRRHRARLQLLQGRRRARAWCGTRRRSTSG